MMRTIAALDMMLYRDVAQVYIEPEPVRSYTSYGTSYLGHGTNYYGYGRGSVFTAADWMLDDTEPEDEEEEDYDDPSKWHIDENGDWIRVYPKKVTTSLDYNVRGSCFICMSKHMLHDEMMVCQECYDRSMRTGRR
jgi:hypothetical protein